MSIFINFYNECEVYDIEEKTTKEDINKYIEDKFGIKYYATDFDGIIYDGLYINITEICLDGTCDFDEPSYCCRDAVYKNHASCLKYYHSNKCKYKHCNKYTDQPPYCMLVLHHDCTYPTDIYTEALLEDKMDDNIEILEYLDKIIDYDHKNWADHPQCDNILAYKGYINCLKYRYKNGTKFHISVCESAAEGGSLECLEYLHYNGFPYNKIELLKIKLKEEIREYIEKNM